MSKLPANEIVARNNERLFLLYENQLKKQTLKDYADTAIKLAAWLSDSKAYYTAARPQIVNLLVTAQMTLREVVGYSTDMQVSFDPTQFLNHSLAASYVRLVQTVAPFRDLFVEPHLKESVVQLLRTVEDISFPSISSPKIPTRSPLPEASGLQGSTKLPAIASPILSPNVSGQSPNTASGATAQKTRATDSVQNMTKGTRSPSPEIVCLGVSKNNIQPPTQNNALLTTHGSPSPKITGKVKSKKKKKIDISAFVQTDRQDFERRQAQAHRQVPDSAPVIKSEPEAEQTLPVTSIEQHVSTVSNSRLLPTEPSIGIPPNHPEIFQNSAAEGHVSLTAQPSIPAAEDSRQLGQHGSSSPTVLQSPGQSIARQNTPLPDPAMEREIREVTPAEILDSRASESLAIVGLPTSSTVGKLGKNDKDGKETSSLQDRLLTSSSNEALAQEQYSVLQGTQSAQTQIAQPLVIPENSELGRLFKWHWEYRSAQPAAEDSVKNVQTNVEENREKISTSAGLADDLTALDSYARVSGRLLQVLALSQGHAINRYLEFGFETSGSDMEPLSKWVNRSMFRIEELVSCYCLSLGCYSSRELKRAISRIPEGAPDNVLNCAVQSLSSTWPRDGGLVMSVSFGGSRKDLPLSPPFLVSEDGLVDVSEFIELGKNRLGIHQGGDFSDYTFVLQLHTPKFKQLQEIVEHRRKEVEWKDWLVETTRPLKISTPKNILSLNETL